MYAFQDADGLEPNGGLINVNGLLYGTTEAGGSGSICGEIGCGTVFSITPAGSLTTVYSFDNGGPGDGFNPVAGLLNFNGNLYGSTQWGGTGNADNCPGQTGCGTLFRLTYAGVETILYEFGGMPDGAYPSSNLINAGGVLYGTTQYGGAYGTGTIGNGTIFAVTRAGAKPVTKIVYSFQGGSDGAVPGALINVGGSLYGITTSGAGTGCGGNGCGTVFKFTP